MNVLDDAKAEIKATRRRFRRAVVLVLSSPVMMGVAAVCAITFGSQLIYARERLPPLGGFSLVQLGLPPLDLGAAGQALGEARDAAVRQGGVEAAQGFLTTHSELIPWLNGAGFVLALAFLAWTMAIQGRIYRGDLEGLAHRA